MPIKYNRSLSSLLSPHHLACSVMSSAQLSFENHLHSDPRTSQVSTFDYAQYPTSSHHALLDDATSGFYYNVPLPQPPLDPHSAYLAEQYDALSAQYYMSAASAVPETHFHHDDHAPSSYHGPCTCQYSDDGCVAHAQVFSAVPNPIVMHAIDAAIGSSHTTLTHRANLAAQVAQHQQDVGSSQGALSGELNPETGQFRRAVPPNRQRTVQACEPCRKRKAKVRLVRVGSLLRLILWLRSAVAGLCADGVSARVSSACTLPSGRCAVPTSRSARV